METATSTVIASIIAVVLVIGIIVGGIVYGTTNGQNRDRTVRLSCIEHGGTYISHTCVIPTR